MCCLSIKALCYILHAVVFWIAHWAMSLPMGWASLLDMLCFSIEALCYILHAVVFWVAHWAMSLPMGLGNQLAHE